MLDYKNIQKIRLKNQLIVHNKTIAQNFSPVETEFHNMMPILLLFLNRLNCLY